YEKNKRVNKYKLKEYFCRIRRNLSVIDSLCGYGNLQRSERTEKLLSKRLNISSNKVEMIRKNLEKYEQRDSVDFNQDIANIIIKFLKCRNREMLITLNKILRLSQYIKICKKE